MNKKLRILFAAAAVFCIITAAISAASFGSSDGVLLYRENASPQAFDHSYESEGGAYLASHYDGSADDEDDPSEVEPQKADYQVNINTATAFELASLLPGIGEKKAAAIVEHRELCGGFRSVEELSEVEGISYKLLDKLRPYCTVE